MKKKTFLCITNSILIVVALLISWELVTMRREITELRKTETQLLSQISNTETAHDDAFLSSNDENKIMDKYDLLNYLNLTSSTAEIEYIPSVKFGDNYVYLKNTVDRWLLESETLEDEVFTLSELVSYLPLDHGEVYRLVEHSEESKIPFYREGPNGEYKFRKSTIDRWWKNRKE